MKTMKMIFVAAVLSLMMAFSMGCGGVPTVEVQGVQFEGEADAKVIVPVVVNGVVVTGVAACEVSTATDGALPLCSLCVEAGSTTFCQCFRGVERVPCPTPVEPEAPVEEVVEPELVEPVLEGGE